MYQKGFTASDFAAIKSRIENVLTNKGTTDITAITADEFVNGVGSVPAVKADDSLSNFVKFYLTNEIFSSIPLAAIKEWDGTEENITDAMNVAGNHAQYIFESYLEFITSKEVVPTITESYDWNAVKPDNDLAIES